MRLCRATQVCAQEQNEQPGAVGGRLYRIRRVK